jgi:DNA-binding NarL/FixJ family response regulator
VNLPPIELEVARLTASGLQDKEIAQSINRSLQAVKNIAQRARRRTRTRNRLELAFWYVHEFPANGTVDPKP